MFVVVQMRSRDGSRFDYSVASLDPQGSPLASALQTLRVPVHDLAEGQTFDLRGVARLRRLIRDGSFDVVHAHSPIAAAAARIAVRTLPRSQRPRMVTTEHALWNSHPGPSRFADRMTAWADDANLAVSSAVRDSLPSRMRLRTEVLRYGIDVRSVVAQRDERDAARRDLGITDDLVIGTFAPMQLAQGWPDVLAAARHVVDSRSDVTFVGIGDGPMMDEVRRLHEHLGLGNRFLLLGPRTDAIRVMAAFDVYCIASHLDGVPVGLMEAMALGLPIVATDVAGVRELVADGVHGTLVPVHRPDLLAGALVKLAANERRRHATADAVRAKTDALSDRRALRRLEAIYESLG